MEDAFKGRGVPCFDGLAEVGDQTRPVARQERCDTQHPFLRLVVRQHKGSGLGDLTELDLLPALEMLHQLLLHVLYPRQGLVLGGPA
jgi:hypothetical protein